MVVRDFEQHEICEGCVDAHAKATAMVGAFLFRSSSLWVDAIRHGSFTSTIMAGRVISEHADRQRREGFAHREHSCDNEPARCVICQFPVIADRCLNPYCGFDSIMNEISTISLLGQFEEATEDQLKGSDHMILTAKMFRLYIRLDGTVFYVKRAR